MSETKELVVIDAVRFDGTPGGAVALFKEIDVPGATFAPSADLQTGHLSVVTHKGVMRADSGDWIVRDDGGRLYLCQPLYAPDGAEAGDE